MITSHNYFNGKRIVSIAVESNRTPDGIFGWIRFHGIMLHQRDKGFRMDEETGYTKQPADFPILETLANRLLFSDRIQGKRQVLSDGAWDDIGFSILPPEEETKTTYRDDVVVLAVRTLMESNYAVHIL